MVRVAPIKLQVGTKVLWFDPNDNDISAGDHVVVKTERGTEYGTATADIMEVSDELVAGLKSPLKPVERVATPEDEAYAAELAAKGEEALAVFKGLAAQTSDQMRPVMVEFLFDGDKAVFYFEAEERIDFRDLVRKLASRFHVRVDMRQIGVRDGARIIGGLGHCGQELCCKRLGGEFSPVSIRMAKEQNLSLNPQKISGCCGRLMCCLRYEYEAYKEVNARAPKHGAKIEVPDGLARVTEVNVPLERVSLQLEDGRTIHVPLAEMEVTGEGKRPTRVSQEVFDKYASADPLEIFGTAATFEVRSFTGEDKVADPVARQRKADQGGADESRRKPRRRRRGGGSSSESKGDKARSGESKNDKTRSGDQPQREGKSKKGEGSTSSSRKPRRSQGQARSKQDSAKKQARPEGKRDGAESQQRKTRRPGQKSSGVRNAPRKSAQPAQSARQGDSAAQVPSGETAHRKPRRRRHKAGGETSNGTQQQQQ